MEKSLFLINSLASGGAEKVVTVLVEELIKKNHEVSIAVLEKNDFYDLPKKVNIYYLSESDGNENDIYKFLKLPFLAYKLFRVTKRMGFVIVQSHTYRSNYVNLLWGILDKNHKSQIVNHGITSRYKEKGLNGKINMFLIKWLYPKADVVITVSKMMMKDLKELVTLKNREEVINNPYNLDKIQKMSKENVLDFEFKKSEKYIVTVGRVIPLKRIEDIIMALNKLPENIHLIIIGEGEINPELVKDVEKKVLFNRVHFLGRLKNPFKYVAKSDIFVLASETEGFPNVLIEAMTCGTPIVSSDCLSGPREILAPESNIEFQLERGIEIAKYGVLYGVGDVLGLVAGINLLLTDSKQYVNYKSHVLKRVREYSVEKIVLQYNKYLKTNE